MACDCYAKEYGLELWAKWIIRDFRERSDHILGKSIWQSINEGGCAGDELGTGRWVWRQQPQWRTLNSGSRNKGEGNQGQVKHAVSCRPRRSPSVTPKHWKCVSLRVNHVALQWACQSFSTGSRWRADTSPSQQPSVKSLHGSYRVETLQIFVA